MEFEMTKFVKIFFMCFCIFVTSANLNAETAESAAAVCGMSQTGDSGSGDSEVEKESTEICENDISFNALYILFHKIFETEQVAEVFDGMFEVSDGTKNFAYATGIGDSIMALFQSLTVIIITVGTILISYSVINIVYKTQTSGEFMGNGQAKVFPVIFNNMLIILLITPIGPILIVQLLMLVVAVLAIMLGNYFWSSFLHATQVKSTEASLSSEITISQSEGIAAELIGTAACMERTNQYILNNQYLKSTEYTDGKLTVGSFLKLDLNESFEKVEQCLQYYVVPVINEDALVSGYNFKRPNIFYCDGTTGVEAIQNAAVIGVGGYQMLTNYMYQEVDYGQEHKCGSITYTQPRIADMNVEENNEVLSNAYLGNYVRNMLDEVKDKVNAKTAFNNFAGQARGKINTLVEQTITADSKKALYDSYDTMIANNYSDYVNLIKVDKEYHSNPKLAGKYMYLKATGVLNQLLGAKYANGTSGFGDVANAIRNQTILRDDTFKHKGINVLINDGKVTEVEEAKYGVETLVNQSKLIYDYLEQAHCAENWLNLKSSLKTALTLNEGFKNDTSSEDVIMKLENKPSFECIKITKKGGDYKVDYNVEGVSDSQKYRAFEVNSGDVEYSGISEDELLAIQDNFTNEVHLEKIKKAMAEKLLLEGYIYYVKMAVSKALTSELKLIQDDGLLIKMRQEGWATSGSMMLQITMDQGNATIFKTGLQKSGMAMSDVYPEEEGSNFSNEEALMIEGKTEETQNEEENNFSVLRNMDLEEFLYSGKSIMDFSSRSSYEQTKENNKSAVVDGFLATIEEQLFSPIIYIKKASGIQQGTTLMSGLEQCRTENKVCVSQDTHPLNALMMFGQDLMANAIIILIIDLVVQTVTLAVDMALGDDQDSGTKDKKKKNGVFKEILSGLKTMLTMPFKGILGALKAISFVLKAIRPVVYTFLFAGIFLGFILPTVPYISFAIVFLGWIITIFQMMVVAPIYVLLAAMDGNSKGQISFNKFWELAGGILLKPALVTIAIIFGWTLSSISLYYVNATIFSLFSATKPDSLLLGVIYTALTYVVYIALVYIVIHHSFKVINKLPDDILSLLNVRGSGDSQFIDNLGVEKFLQAKIMSDTIQGVHGNLGNKVEGKQNQLDRTREKEKDDKLQALRQAEMEKDKSTS
jgi:hypothetical protein